MYKAEIKIRYASDELARSIRDSLEPDNDSKSGHARVSSHAEGRVLRVRVVGVERVETLQATVEDIFRCIHAAEASLTKLIAT